MVELRHPDDNPDGVITIYYYDNQTVLRTRVTNYGRYTCIRILFILKIFKQSI